MKLPRGRAASLCCHESNGAADGRGGAPLAWPSVFLAWRGAAFWTILSAMFALFHRLPRNVIRIFTRWNLGWHALAIFLTIIIVMSGLDWSYYCATRGEVLARLALPAIILGGLVPLLGIPAVLLAGAVTRNRRLLATAWGGGQAALLGYLISSGYKAFTGRIPPPFRGFGGMGASDATALDTSHGFRLGFLKGGIFWGWPSGHTTVAFSMAVCLITLYPKRRLTVCLALFYAFYVGLGVSLSIHRLSEFVAGAIIGSVIGRTVGESFRERLVGNQ